MGEMPVVVAAGKYALKLAVDIISTCRGPLCWGLQSP